MTLGGTDAGGKNDERDKSTVVRWSPLRGASEILRLVSRNDRVLSEKHTVAVVEAVDRLSRRGRVSKVEINISIQDLTPRNTL